ncbi:hypothetical protein ACFQX7_26425 [Luedemannella flava]
MALARLAAARRAGAAQRPLAAGGAASVQLVAQIEELIAGRAAGAQPTPAVVLLVADASGASRESLLRVAEHGPTTGCT